MSYQRKHVHCHSAKVVSSSVHLAAKNFKDTSVGLVWGTRQSCQASLPPRQKLPANVLNAWTEKRPAPFRLRGDEMTPAARRPHFSRLPALFTSRCTEWRDGEHPSQNQIAPWIASRGPAAMLLLWVQCIHSYTPTPISRDLSRRKHTYLVDISIAAPSPKLSLLKSKLEINVRVLFWFQKTNGFHEEVDFCFWLVLIFPSLFKNSHVSLGGFYL